MPLLYIYYHEIVLRYYTPSVISKNTGMSWAKRSAICIGDHPMVIFLTFIFKISYVQLDVSCVFCANFLNNVIWN